MSTTRVIRKVVRRVAVEAPELGAHLDASIVTGKSCRYDPRSAGPPCA